MSTRRAKDSVGGWPRGGIPVRSVFAGSGRVFALPPNGRGILCYLETNSQSILPVSRDTAGHRAANSEKAKPKLGPTVHVSL